ncbi:MAG: HAD family hydrolase [Phycisphaerales bacterium JB037]
MLVLFDIDATLISTSRAGMHAMLDAGRSLFGDSFTIERTEFAGRLDPLIIADLLLHNGQEPTLERIERMTAGYASSLERRLAEPGVARALPGVPQLLDALTGTPGVTIGLLTGNFEPTGRLKLTASGVDPDRFVISAWGSDSPSKPPTRNDLPRVAMDRYGLHAGTPIAGERVVVIGDTIHDIACARAHGCRVIGVATGQYRRDQLAHADLPVDTLEDTGHLVDWMLQATAPPPCAQSE